MKIRRLQIVGRACAIVVLGAGVGVLAGSVPQLDAAGQKGQRQATTTGQMSRQDAEFVARRLYPALLNREPDQTGLRDTVTALQLGNLEQRVQAIVDSREFKNRTSRLRANQILDQISQGLLGHRADTEFVRDYQAFVQKNRIPDAVVRIISSEAFQNRLAADRGNARAPGGAGIPATVDFGRALPCQENVVEQVRNDLPGAVLLRFETPDTSGNDVRGAAFDVLDGNRRLTYRCDGGPASYSYDDGRRGRSAPNDSDFPNDAVRACQNAIRDQVKRERNVADVAFESAGVMPNSAGQAVRGLGFERSAGGQGGANFHYQCDVDGTRVASARYRMR